MTLLAARGIPSGDGQVQLLLQEFGAARQAFDRGIAHSNRLVTHDEFTGLRNEFTGLSEDHSIALSD